MEPTIYETKDLLEVLSVLHTPDTFLLDTFVTDTIYHDTDTIEIDIEREGETVASYCSPMVEGEVVKKESFETLTHKIPYIKQKEPFTAALALTRRAGMTSHNNENPQSMITREITKTFTILEKRIIRLEEKQLGAAIQTGLLRIKGRGVDYVIDMKMKDTHKITLTGADLWSTTTADIANDYKTVGQLVTDDSGLMATMAIHGRNASSAMLKNAEYMGTLDRRKIDRGEIIVQKLGKNVVYYGFDRESGLDLYGYTANNKDSEGVKTDVIDADSVVIAAVGARCEKHYGLIQNMNALHMGARFPSNWITDDPSVHWIMLESAPVVVPHAIDAFACMKVL